MMFFLEFVNTFLISNTSQSFGYANNALRSNAATVVVILAYEIMDVSATLSEKITISNVVKTIWPMLNTLPNAAMHILVSALYYSFRCAQF